MSDRQVSIKYVIEQIENGRRYKGTISVGGVTFGWDWTFGDNFAKNMHTKPLRELITIKIQRADGRDLPITEAEETVFIVLLMKPIGDFYYDPQIREANDLLARAAARGVFPTEPPTFKVDQSATGTFGAELCEILSSPEFGCKF